MRVSIKQMGGFSGTTVELAAVDVDRLDPGRAVAVKQTVEAARFFELPTRLPSTEVGADLLTYEITIEEGGRRHTVTFGDDNSPLTAPLRRLRDVMLHAT